MIRMADWPTTLSNEEWKKILDSAVDDAAIIITDSDGTIIWANQDYSELTGYSLIEVFGHQITILKRGQKDSSFYREIWTDIGSGKIWSGQVVNQRKDGSRYLEAVEIRPVISDDGSITHILIIKKDITEHKAAKKPLMSKTQKRTIEDDLTEPMAQLTEIAKALDHARSQMSAMLDAANDGMMLLSPEGKILRINESFSRMFSVNETEVLDRPYSDHAEHWETVFGNDSIVELLLDESDCDKSEERTFMQEWPVRRELQVYSSSVRDTEDDYLGKLVVFRDITPEREAERLKSEFVSLVTHEFRTPLTSIKGYAEMMLDGDTGELTDEQREFLETVCRNADYLSELVDELLEVSRIEAGAMRLDIREFDISATIEKVVDQMRPQIERKEQELSIDVPQDVPKVEADERRTSQIILNLVSNAHKYTPSDGNITISAAAERDHVRVDIADNGIGLTEDERDQIFSKFFRADNPETAKERGTGLGLWITRSLVEMQGGEISVQSRPGEGSTFSFTIPTS